MSRVPVERALLSVWDKTGIAEFARRLHEAGVELVSSGGTAAALEKAGLPVVEVAEVTGAAEMLGGRVKTLHPKIHGGILADLGRQEHRGDLQARGIAPFQLVVVNLYPFEATVADPDTSPAAAIEKIDVGGPTMVRAAAKNHGWVAVVTSPDQYGPVADAVELGGLDEAHRRELAAAAFFRTAAYDAAIVGWFERSEQLPARLVMPLERVAQLRYGENPHQEAALYGEVATTGWWRTATQLQGKEMSFNNYVDTEAAWRLVADLTDPSAVIVKHTNACGAASCDSVESAFGKAWDCDPLSAFGSVVALNRIVDAATAELIATHFVEVVIAPDIDADAAGVLAAKKNLRLLTASPPDGIDIDLRRIEHGVLLQRRDRISLGGGPLPEGWDTVAGGPLRAGLAAELEFAWTVAAHTKSNAIVIAKDRAAVGVGAGDQSRVGAAERALARAGPRSRGSVAASDAFLPFRDSLDALADAGVVALVEPGGSVRDDEVIAAAEERGMTLVFTGRRHFRH
ncbi:MAG TPA: bifunctional phosphoribosylaminoimidazolecarboxamide formyltransferase/IMP cyclohydrolase [Acidimicrobiia bacterium]|nr:bifunctional phosphoribosylaminoimidazolecarboxamide formyltransferase/IMP cyclohydrolase [Acidimicrobiia bacterium]